MGCEEKAIVGTFTETKNQMENHGGGGRKVQFFFVVVSQLSRLKKDGGFLPGNSSPFHHRVNIN